jgi:hypothetical protein
MPFYASMIFGVRGRPAIDTLADALEVKVDWREDAYLHFTRTPQVQRLQKVLERVHADTLTALSEDLSGLQYIRYGSETEKDLGVFSNFVQTPWGRWEFTPMWLDLSYDRYEVHDTDETAVFGVYLSARYCPCLLDMHSEHGGLEAEIDEDEYQKNFLMWVAGKAERMVIPEYDWDKEAMPWQRRAAEIAQEKIVAAIPELAACSLLQKREFA